MKSSNCPKDSFHCHLLVGINILTIYAQYTWHFKFPHNPVNPCQNTSCIFLSRYSFKQIQACHAFMFGNKFQLQVQGHDTMSYATVQQRKASDILQSNWPFDTHLAGEQLKGLKTQTIQQDRERLLSHTVCRACYSLSSLISWFPQMLLSRNVMFLTNFLLPWKCISNDNFIKRWHENSIPNM